VRFDVCSRIRHFLKLLLNCYTVAAPQTLSPAYAAPPSLIPYTNRPFGHRRRCTKRLVIVLAGRVSLSRNQWTVAYLRLFIWYSDRGCFSNFSRVLYKIFRPRPEHKATTDRGHTPATLKTFCRQICETPAGRGWGQWRRQRGGSFHLYG